MKLTWNTTGYNRAVVLGDSIIHHIIEGDTLLTYTKPQIGGWEQENKTGWLRGQNLGN